MPFRILTNAVLFGVKSPRMVMAAPTARKGSHSARDRLPDDHRDDGRMGLEQRMCGLASKRSKARVSP